MKDAITAEAGNRIDARDVGTLRAALDRVGPLFDRLLSPKASGTENLTTDGAALAVANHSGGQLAMFEPLVLAHAMREIGIANLPTLLLHDVMWRLPITAWLERAGAVRASPSNVDGLLRAGKKVLVYPGGDREVFRPFTHRDRIELGERRGYMRAAIRHGVPIIPVVTSGIQSGFVSLSDGHALASKFSLARKLRVGVLPVTLSFPFGISIGVPLPYIPLASDVRVRALPPIYLPRTGEEASLDDAYVEACHEHVRTTMQQALHELADARRRQRRAVINVLIDRVLSFFEKLALAPREEITIAPLPRPSHLSIVRPSRPSLPPAARDEPRVSRAA